MPRDLPDDVHTALDNGTTEVGDKAIKLWASFCQNITTLVPENCQVMMKKVRLKMLELTSWWRGHGKGLGFVNELVR